MGGHTRIPTCIGYMPLSSRGQPCSVGSPPTIVALHVRSITALGRIILRFFFFSVFVLFSFFHPVWAHIHRHYGQGKTCGLSSNFFLRHWAERAAKLHLIDSRASTKRASHNNGMFFWVHRGGKMDGLCLLYIMIGETGPRSNMEAKFQCDRFAI
ncbi:hypothetical protein V8F06_002347 [Rhypophila decipiens]